MGKPRPRGTVQAKGDKWYAVLSHTDATGERKRVWSGPFDTSREAQIKLTALNAARDAGKWVAPSKQSVTEYLGRWLKDVELELKPSTLRSYDLHIKSYINPRIGGITLRKLTPLDLNHLYRDLSKSGGRDGAALSNRTVRLTHTIIRKAFDDGVASKELSWNPAVGAKPPKQQPMRTWAPTDVAAFLDYLTGDRLYALYHLAATTGMRRGEVLGLRWDDVRLDDGILEIVQTLLSIGGDVVWGTPKTDKSRRSVAIDRGTVDVLRSHRKRQLEDRIAAGVLWSNARNLVFTHEDGTRLHPDTITRRFKRHIHAAGLPVIRFHDLRHTWATLALRSGVNPKIVSDRLGHSGVAITLDVYSHAIPSMQREAAEDVAALIRGV